jgi:TonB family protein
VALTSGSRLGPYEVIAPLGSGGMGEVYRAHDTKLGRDVAIKILPSAFSNDPERLARFEREARLLATLNHPHQTRTCARIVEKCAMLTRLARDAQVWLSALGPTRHELVMVGVIGATVVPLPHPVGDVARGARTPWVSVQHLDGPDAGQTADMFVPARRIGGPLPAPPPPTVIGWIEETLEVVIDVTGRVAAVRPLRATQMRIDPIGYAVADWRFRPATEQGRAVPSRVLVAAIVRPPQLYDTPTLGAPPVDLAAPSGEIPFPIGTAPPRYPPLAIGDAVVLVEALVTPEGRTRQLRIISGAPPFDQASLDAASQWSFRPARWNDRAVEAYAYLAFGFRQPI